MTPLHVIQSCSVEERAIGPGKQIGSVPRYSLKEATGDGSSGSENMLCGQRQVLRWNDHATGYCSWNIQLRDWMRFGIEFFKSLAMASQAKALRQLIESLSTEPTLFPSEIDRLESRNNYPCRIYAKFVQIRGSKVKVEQIGVRRLGSDLPSNAI